MHNAIDDIFDDDFDKRKPAPCTSNCIHDRCGPREVDTFWLEIDN